MIEFICKYCQSARKNKNSLIQHELKCPSNPSRNYINGYKGKVGWNRGLTEATDERIRKASTKVREGYKSGRITPAFLGKHHTEEWKERESRRRSINNRGGRCKWYEVQGQMVQGTWEKALAEKMQSLNLQWQKIKTNSETISYKQNDKIRHYTPDFKCETRHLEVKGFWRKEDKEKMIWMFKSNPDYILHIIEKEKYLKLLMASTKEDFLVILDTCKCCGSLDSQAGD